MEQAKTTMPTICVIGNMRVGKSSFLNSLCGEQTTFKVSASADPVTNVVSVEERKWFGDKTEDPVRLIDTPGLGDPEDEQNVYNMIETLEKVCTINTFVIVINGSNPRFDNFLKGMLDLFANLFDFEFFKNVLIVFTRWAYDKKAEKSRKVNGDTEEKRTREWNQKIKEHFGFDTESCSIPCVFLDNDYNNPEIRESSEDFEVERFRSELQAIKKFSQRPPFECRDLLKKQRFEKLQLYFDESDFHKPPSFANDIYSILKEFNEKDDTTRVSREKYEQVLAQEVEKQLLGRVLESLVKILDSALKEDLQKIGKLKEDSSAVADIFGYGGPAAVGIAGGLLAANVTVISTTIGTSLSWGAVSGFAALEGAAAAGATAGSMTFVGAAAATGIGLAIVGAGAGIYTIVKASWKRQTLLEELAPKLRNKILEGNFRKTIEAAVKVTYGQLVRKSISQKFAKDNKGNNSI